MKPIIEQPEKISGVQAIGTIVVATEAIVSTGTMYRHQQPPSCSRLSGHWRLKTLNSMCQWREGFDKRSCDWISQEDLRQMHPSAVGKDSLPRLGIALGREQNATHLTLDAAGSKSPE